MLKKDDQLEEIRELINKKKVLSLQMIAAQVMSSERTIQRYLKELNGLTSYTHRGKFVTLPEITQFDSNEIWFYRQIGFSKYGSSLDAIIGLINRSEHGVSRDELEEILRIGISKQIQILLKQERLHRVKVGNKYIYIPEEAATNKKKMLRIVGSRKIEEHYDVEVKISDLIAVLKVVLQEGRIEMRLLKRWIKKYSLKIPLGKLESLIMKHKLDEKKTP